MDYISEAVLEQSIDYHTYRSLISELLAESKTTGDNHSEAMINYTELNAVRMNRLDKTTKLTEESKNTLQHISRPLIWLTLTEAWCGDAAQVLPVLQHLANESSHNELRLILRDEQPEVMNAFLTNGGKSIPKVIILDAKSREVLGSWGPRPADVQQMVMDTKKDMEQMTDKAEKAERYQELVKSAQKWYAKDKTQSIQREFLGAVQESIGIPAETL